MARKKQKLINYHSSVILSAQTQTEAQIAGNLSYGEITVIHAPEQPLIGTKIGDDKVAWFMSSGQVETSIHEAITGATGAITELQTKVNHLSSATDTFINTTAPDTYLTKTDALSIYVGQSAMTDYYTKEDADGLFLSQSAASKTYATSADVVSAIEDVAGDLDGLTTRVADNEEAIENLTTGLSATVVSDYSTTAQMNSAIAVASAASVNSAKSYVDTVIADYATSADVVSAIEAEKTRATGAEDALSTRVGSLETKMNTITEEDGLSATVIANKAKLDTLEETYETKDDANTKYTSAITYVDTASGNIETYIHETYWTSAETQDQLTGITQNISDLSGSVIATSGAVKTLSGDVVNYVDTKLSTVYTYKNSVQSKSDLPRTGNKTGDVYNVIDGDGTPGEAGYTPPGTNYAWNGSEWDALGGTIDLSAYATKDYVTGITSPMQGDIAALQTATGNLNTNINYVSGQVDTLSGKVVSDYYTKTVTDETFLKIAEADKKYYTSGQVETTYLKKEDAQNTYLTITSANSTFDTITTSISNLSGTTHEIETKVNNSISAVTTAQVTTPDNTTNTEYASGVKIDTDNAGRVTKFDFSELVIDCGEYGNE